VRASVAHNKWRVETTTWPALRLPRLADEGLARLAARGNTRAFAVIYERYHQTLYRYCRSILKDDVDSQDALQSTFTRALSALQRGQRSAPLRPWLFRIAHNEAISLLRRRRRGQEPLGDATLPMSVSAEDQAGDRARLETLLGDLASLPERARSALVMRELSGLSHDEIAVSLNISPGAAKQAIFEARRGIAECAEGREMACAEVCQAISDGDRRVLRGRRVRAHLRDCASCSEFAASIEARQVEMRAIVPLLPAAASAIVLARAVESAVGGGALGASGAGGAAAGVAGKAAGAAIVSKGFTAASVLATAAVTVGGVAAVVRIDASRRPAKPHRAQIAQPGPTAARHVAAHASASRVGSSAVGSTRTVQGAGAASVRHVRFVYAHGHGPAGSWHQSIAAGRGEWGRRAHGRVDGGWGSHGRHSEGHHGQGAMPRIRHDTLVGYAGERGHDANASWGVHGWGGGDSRAAGHGRAIGHHK
jgi:RNA polymerase sigma factor (sigma-70 family)